jgi:hypothetical protein
MKFIAGRKRVKPEQANSKIIFQVMEVITFKTLVVTLFNHHKDKTLTQQPIIMVKKLLKFAKVLT